MCCGDVSSLVAGALIGWLNDSWALRFLVPFIWGVVYLAYLSIAGQEKKERYLATAQGRTEKPARWFRSHGQAYWFVEYTTAVFTSMFVAIVAGLIKIAVR